MRSRLLTTVMALLCGALLILGPACKSTTGDATQNTGSGGATAKEVKVGAVLSLTQGAAVYGAVQKNGIEMARDEINASNYIPGYRLNVIVDDDASDKAPGINVFQRMINQERVSAIIGPTLSNTALATDPLAQQAKVPVIGVSNTANGITEIGDYIFRDSLAEAQVIPGAVKKAMDSLKFKKAAVLYGNDDAFTKSGYDVFKQALDDNKVEIVSTETFAKGDKNFAAQLTNIKGKTPDVIIVSALAEEAAGILVQARQLGLTQPVIGGNGFNSPALIQNAGQAAEGVIIGAAWNSGSTNSKSQQFIQKYKEKYGSEPDQFAAQAYSGVYILAEAIKMANSGERDAIRNSLVKIKNYDTVLGSFSFTAGRDADHPATANIVKGGKFVPLQ
jgi:branched-chain amino acid transport system substrate-binding protein